MGPRPESKTWRVAAWKAHEIVNHPSMRLLHGNKCSAEYCTALTGCGAPVSREGGLELAAKSAAGRVARAAKDEAKRQGLGKTPSR